MCILRMLAYAKTSIKLFTARAAKTWLAPLNALDAGTQPAVDSGDM
jgi:hypothetical protein